MFETKVYTSYQRKLYGWGWFAIAFVICLVLTSYGWNKLAIVASIFGAMSLYAAYFGTNDDSQNPCQIMCPKCQDMHGMFDLNKDKKATIFIYKEGKPRIRRSDGLEIYPLICFKCKNLTEWASDTHNYSGNATCGFEYFKTKKVTKKDINEALDDAKKIRSDIATKKLNKILE